MSLSAGVVLRRLRATALTAREEANRIEVPATGGSSLAHLVEQVMQHARQDAVLAFAGNLAYNAFLALFPFLLFLVSVLRAVHATGLITGLADLIEPTLPHQAAQLVRRQILPEVISRLPDSPLLSVSLALGSLWAVSFVARAVVQAMNRMYEVEDGRPLWQRFLLPLVFSLGAAALFLAALVLIVFGSSIGVSVGKALGSGSVGWWAWAVLRWPALLGIAFLAFALTFYFGPDPRRRPPFINFGVLLSTVVWLLFTAAFSVTLNNFVQFLITPLYGWFTGLIVLLMYLYWSSVIVLVGAEVNLIVSSVAREGAGKGSGHEDFRPQARRGAPSRG